MVLARTSPNVPIACRQLAESGQMPERFLLQILRGLVANGVLHSVIGTSGGYYLARSPNQITLLQIFDAFENPLTTPQMPDLPGIDPRVARQLSACVEESAFAARQEFAKLTVADLIRSQPDANGQFSDQLQLSSN